MADAEHHVDKKSTKSVLPAHMGGGPHGLGDPNDKSLRHVEEVMIRKMMREAAKEKCSTLVDAFVKCGKESGFLLPFKCRKEAREMQLCQLSWMDNPEFQEKYKEIYLKERTEYRSTGIKKKEKRRESATL